MAYDFSRLNVVVIDSNAFSRRILRSLLNAVGVPSGSQKEMPDPESALTDLKHFLPDLVFCEINFPGMSGIDYIKAVRQQEDEEARYLPIIVCTAHTDQRRVLACRDAGAHEVLHKPMSVKTLYQHVVSVIEHPRSFVYAPVFAGPDRRRRKETPVKTRRSDDQPA